MIWLVLSSRPTYHFLTDDSLQFAEKNNKKPCCGRETARTVVKFDVSKFTAASRDSPCDSTAFVFTAAFLFYSIT